MTPASATARQKSLLSTLRPLRGEITQRQFSIVDFEATEWVNVYAAGFYDGKTFTSFVGETSVEDVLEHILTPAYAGQWIYAHNGGNYDFLFVVNRLLTSPRFRRRYLVEITPVGSSLIRIEVAERDKDFKNEAARNSKGQLKWTFVDSVRLMPVRLNEVGETFGIGQKVELDISYNELAQPKHRKKMLSYLETDCRLLWRAVDQMQKTINSLGGQIGVTLPATALDIFRRQYQDRDIHTNRHFLACKQHNTDLPRNARPKDITDKCKGCMHDFIRGAYYGGRTEIYRMRYRPSKGHERAYIFDINSHYPHCMLEPMPVGEAIELEGLTEKQIYANAKQLVGIVDCDVWIPEDCYLPPLPHQHKGKLKFFTGYFRGKWDTAELCLLKEVGGKILKSYKSVWFETAPVFARFVTRIYKYRDKSDPKWNKGMDWIAKILLNSLYGKFGMREYREKMVINPGKKIDGLECMDLEADLWKEDLYVSPAYIVPQLSTHVTALARARLWRHMKHGVLDKGGRLYYADTDSIFCSGVKLKTSTELGGLKLEATIKRGEFVLPKLYLIDQEMSPAELAKAKKKKTKEATLKIKAKGMGPGIKLGDDGKDDEFGGQLSEQEFMDVTRAGMKLPRHRLSKLKESLRKYAKGAHMFPVVSAAPKQIKTKYDKRRVLDDYDTRPHYLKGQKHIPFQSRAQKTI